MTSTKIIAKRDTWFKKETTLQANMLPDDQKHFVPKGTAYPVLSYRDGINPNYESVELGYEAGIWQIYTEHWIVPWLDTGEEDTSKSGTIGQIVTETKAPSSYQDINWQNMSAQVSKYFTVREVTQGEKRRIPYTEWVKRNVFSLARELDEVREAWGNPIGVTSWYRPPAVNRAVGGASQSQHLNGGAVDIYPVGGNIYALQSMLDNQLWTKRALGYGAKKGFVHLDMRPGRIRWNY